VKHSPKFAIALAVAATSFIVHSAGPANADPDLDKARKLVDSLYSQAEQASERLNEARVQLKASRVQLKALQADVRTQQKSVDALGAQVKSMVVEQYQGGSLSTATQLVFSDNPDTFLSNLNAVSAYDAQRTQLMAQYATVLDELRIRQAAADQEVAASDALHTELTKQKALLDEKSAAAKAEVNRLEGAQLDALMSGDLEVPADIPASGRAKIALRYALAQVGDRYVWGAAGPNSFDCSGLMMAAWGAAGVSLPHSSSAQQGSGPRVSEANLQPGDLVFYYSPVHHVGMYIGGGRIVHAANPGEGVRIDPLHRMPYVGAVRPG